MLLLSKYGGICILSISIFLSNRTVQPTEIESEKTEWSKYSAFFTTVAWTSNLLVLLGFGSYLSQKKLLVLIISATHSLK